MSTAHWKLLSILWVLFLSFKCYCLNNIVSKKFIGRNVIFISSHFQTFPKQFYFYYGLDLGNLFC